MIGRKPFRGAQMKIDEWHAHFEKMMTRLSEARERLKAAGPHSVEFHGAHKEVRTVMHELDCLTNPSLTPIEHEANEHTEAIPSEPPS
jgi:hypothetical protein